MVKLYCFDVQIVQNDVAAPEHTDPTAESEEGAVTTYVEIKEDEKFAIRFTVDESFQFNDYNGLAVSLSMDGKPIGGYCYDEEDICEGEVTIKTIDGISYNLNGRALKRMFRFEEVEKRILREKETKESVIEKYKEQGCISVELARVSGMLVAKPENESDGIIEKLEPVPKDAVKHKGATSRANYDDMDLERHVPVFMVSVEEDPSAVFHLRYRTSEVLRDLRILKESPFIGPLELIVIEDDDDTIEQLRAQLAKAEQKLAEAEIRIKQEEPDDHENERGKKRKYLEFMGTSDTILLDERPAHRRLPTADDEVIILDD